LGLIDVVVAACRSVAKPCPEICPELRKSEVISGHILGPGMALQSQKWGSLALYGTEGQRFESSQARWELPPVGAYPSSE